MVNLNYFAKLNSIITVLLLCLGLAGCSNTPQSSNGFKQQAALDQAEKYTNLAKKAEGSAAVSYQLQAVEQYLRAEDVEAAEQTLKEIKIGNKQKLDQNNQALKQILLAQVALSKQDLATAKKELNQIWTPNKLPNHLQIKFYQTRSEVYRRGGNLVDAVQERIQCAKLLTNQQELQANNRVIWDTLSQLTPSTLKVLQKEQAKDDLNGWLVFTNITKQYDASPEQLFKALAYWKQQFPNHPAREFMPKQLADLAQPNDASTSNFDSFNNSFTKPKKIALILPLQGTHAKSAQAVRDGFLAAFYAHKDETSKPKISVYDTSEKRSLQAIYRQAVDDGADFIVGPLVKEEVEELSSGVRPQVPVLALNTGNNTRTLDNLYHFSLSPEMEAQLVAKKAWADGHRNAVIIIPQSVWGERMKTAFQDYWLNLGGRIANVAQIQSQANLNREMQRLLGIDTSEARAEQLTKLGLKFGFEPRRRQDIDMVFIATNAALARQVKPLLNFYFAGNIAAYASSSVFSGKIQPAIDQDLNGVQFCDMPWLLDGSLGARGAYKQVADLWPQEFEQYARLYALGLDAYKIALQMEQMTMLPDLGISGMTGMLTINQQQVQRKLMWASFKKGIPQVGGEQL